ncbi:MAG TPA: polyketide synthase dehydratase domain-containing protein, partial [Solirubrobacterales bacterium]|nr:polyketide synthase dehydratase domain-containing protein [Solirubrobacterales bacterium]
DAAHWYRSLRQPVLFEQATRALLADGFGLFLEASPHPVLTMAVEETAEAAAPEPVAALGTLRRDEGGLASFAAALAAAQVHGAAVEWAPLLAGAHPVPLPAYPFQRQRFWVEPAAGAGDASALGQAATGHPLLGASIALASEDSHLFTGQVSLELQPWLADHAVAGTPILPAAAFAELALCAGRELGAERLRELTLEAPLVLPAQGTVQLRIAIAASSAGERELEIHSRPQPTEPGAGEEAPFVRHAVGVLAAQRPERPGSAVGAWPPAGAEPLAVDAFYDTAAAAGLDYGPAFQGLEAAWKLGEEVYADVALAPEQAGDAAGFGVHPALLDAALHPALLDADPAAGLRLPFSLTGVALHGAGGVSALRVRIVPTGERIAITASDRDGNPVFSIESLSSRSADPAQLGLAAERPGSLFALAWEPHELAAAGEAEGAEPVRLSRAAGGDNGSGPLDPPAAAQALAAAALERLQEAIASGSEARLAFLTSGAVAAAAGEAPDPAQAAVWGLVRSAQSEHPGRFLLIDSDGSEASEAALAAALAQSEEPQLALREGTALAPR